MVPPRGAPQGRWEFCARGAAFHPVPLPPLCKGRWIAVGKTERLLYHIVAFQLSRTIPQPSPLGEGGPLAVDEGLAIASRCGKRQPPLPPSLRKVLRGKAVQIVGVILSASILGSLYEGAVEH